MICCSSGPNEIFFILRV